MAEPIPSASNAADAADDETQNLPNNAEDRKAAAALNALNANAMSQEGDSSNKQPSAADQEALGKAMSRLEIVSGLGKKSETKKPEQKKEAEVKKKIKVSNEDVAFLVRKESINFPGVVAESKQVDELDLSKAKATELIRSHDGDVIKAARAYIAPAVKV
ncbi:uncharacterized protein AB675_671 [Cyphellophora attinorum]|uniref:Nascent polypeptide-associated complex subunit alpha-like UBA domain-containing protein n=1 Tax=Cyphellophora attinorum TaxID=1664694 RepID=A0A0N1HYN4_9EURO|nr:uncharacterized protein AB675_671 [Phialophora attinorum]KPI46000.1 hypothetical protein AB675_671 [Phialophora attinorum]